MKDLVGIVLHIYRVQVGNSSHNIEVLEPSKQQDCNDQNEFHHPGWDVFPYSEGPVHTYRSNTRVLYLCCRLYHIEKVRHPGVADIFMAS